MSTDFYSWMQRRVDDYEQCTPITDQPITDQPITDQPSDRSDLVRLGEYEFMLCVLREVANVGKTPDNRLIAWRDLMADHAQVTGGDGTDITNAVVSLWHDYKSRA